ncbi:unnamed protein product [Darwinula stevensoni]|uniref:C2H2-type domain-containing protein n=1 Tax=Darwinula stevensoni TaxID=69355 RepID=A0A7R9A717_9CRUS|nr:unnamed protein product [Darwinula stevensoni]CAG0889805.1 unnamed protein product [Darwinula stevensoni]
MKNWNSILIPMMAKVVDISRLRSSDILKLSSKSKCTFPCLFCPESLPTKAKLSRHWTEVHQFKRKNGKEFKCSLCNQVFSLWKTLIKHRLMHADVPDASSLKTSHCDSASNPHQTGPGGLSQNEEDTAVRCLSSDTVVSGEENGHDYVQPLPSPLTRRRMRNNKCPCIIDGCPAMFRFVGSLSKHLAERHRVVLQKVDKVFASSEEFKCWKDQLEREECAEFIKNGGQYPLKKQMNGASIGFTQTYICNRDGNLKTKKRSLQGTGSLVQHCPAWLKVTTYKNGRVHVTGTISHYGHDTCPKLVAAFDPPMKVCATSPEHSSMEEVHDVQGDYHDVKESDSPGLESADFAGLDLKHQIGLEMQSIIRSVTQLRNPDGLRAILQSISALKGVRRQRRMVDPESQVLGSAAPENGANVEVHDPLHSPALEFPPVPQCSLWLGPTVSKCMLDMDGKQLLPEWIREGPKPGGMLRRVRAICSLPIMDGGAMKKPIHAEKLQYSMLRKRLLLDVSTYLKDPADLDFYHSWLKTFDLHEKMEDLQSFLDRSPEVQKIYSELVPWKVRLDHLLSRFVSARVHQGDGEQQGDPGHHLWGHLKRKEFHEKRAEEHGQETGIGQVLHGGQALVEGLAEEAEPLLRLHRLAVPEPEAPQGQGAHARLDGVQGTRHSSKVLRRKLSHSSVSTALLSPSPKLLRVRAPMLASMGSRVAASTRRWFPAAVTVPSSSDARSVFSSSSVFPPSSDRAAGGPSVRCARRSTTFAMAFTKILEGKKIARDDRFGVEKTSWASPVQ